MSFNTYKDRTLVQMKIHANEQAAEIERLRALLLQTSEYIEIYAETIRHEPWRQNALTLIASINAIPGARDRQN